MKIGEFARAAGVSPSKVRFYEARGLLLSTARRPNGYRSYSLEDLERLMRIKRARALGFSLDQIARFMTLPQQDRKAKLGVVEAAESKLAELDEHLSELRERRSRMLAFIAEVKADKSGASEAIPTDEIAGVGNVATLTCKTSPSATSRVPHARKRTS